MSVQTSPTRRTADGSDGAAPNRDGLLQLAFISILIATVALFGWWFWRQVIGGHAVRETSPSWSGDSTQVIFSAEEEGKNDLFVMNARGGNRQPLTRTSADESGAAYSPDGKQIAFESDRDGNFEIYVAQSDGSAARPLTNHPARDMAPSWSPDGRHIVFMSTRDNPEFDIYQMDASDGGRVERLTTEGFAKFPQYSPDGSQIAMQIKRDVYVLSLKDRSMRRLTHEPLNGMHPTWSSDARQIAFMSWRNGRTEIFIAKANGLDPQLLVSMPAGDAADPRWSPNGQLITFVHYPGGGLAEARNSNPSRIIYVVDIQTKRLTRLSR